MADTAVVGERVGFGPPWAARILAALSECLAAEGERRLLWLPVFFGAGIGAYFVLKVEPPLWPGVAAAIVGAGLSIALRRHPAWCEAALVLTVFAAGFALICETARERQAPMLQRHLGPVTVTGRVADIDLAEKGWRIIIEPDPLAGLEPTARPHRLRLHIPQTSDEHNPGDHVRLKAMLYPVPPQILPGGRDFQRELYFAGIGGVGYSYCGARRISGPEGASEGGDGWAEHLRHLRTEMTRRINAVLPGSTGGVASALITGKRGAIAEEVKQSFRDSGLSHLIGDRRAASGPRRRLCVLRRARRPGADPSGRLALSDQEDRCRSHARRPDLLSVDLGCCDPDRTRLRHEWHRLCGDPDRPVANLDADLRDCRCGCARPRSGEPGRRQLSDVVWCGCRPGCRLRDLWRTARAHFAWPFAIGGSRGVLRGGGGHNPRRYPWHLSVFDLPLSPRRALFPARQCHCGAGECGVDTAFGGRHLPVNAVRARASGIDPDGLGDRSDDL